MGWEPVREDTHKECTTWDPGSVLVPYLTPAPYQEVTGHSHMACPFPAFKPLQKGLCKGPGVATTQAINKGPVVNPKRGCGRECHVHPPCAHPNLEGQTAAKAGNRAADTVFPVCLPSQTSSVSRPLRLRCPGHSEQVSTHRLHASSRKGASRGAGLCRHRPDEHLRILRPKRI